MKKVLKALSQGAAALTVATGLGMAALPAHAESTYTKEHPLKVALVLNGTLGDKSFFDSAQRGMDQAMKELPVTVKTIEPGYDRGKWQPALADAADGDYDVIIAGTFDMAGFVADIAPQYPDKKFILFDDTVDYSKGGFDNVLSVQYRTSTAAYLAGYAAAKVSKTGTLGQILGTEGSVILEFVVGFEQGAKAANPNAKLLRATVNSATPFNDPAKGKELALAQIQQGADVIFPIAGSTGIGALQAARDDKKLAIGVDSDQATIFAATDPAQAEVILTSVEKRVGESLFLILKQTVDGTAKYGTSSILGLQEGAVGISENKYYDALVPEAVRKEVKEQEQKIISGEIKVETTMN
ncbi:basic membrane protein A [Kaistia hirudinis]|uniref:Basic membrane protein A n=1 Tax=Kaistia hirudinis TaxID=1293440 RepID=A0A840ARZ5_9HYPH|nr:BMP family ABC transporter substrate-binding protein [Kaistia hirudinis]MBB3932274.1 basic membrane protein A [Kaistia hirudinis]MBN9016910.1 BMP family ABC transporter substrate-binding protein [Hyphomicrobiales bacterium]